MRHFFYPESIAVFGVSDRPSNLAKSIVGNLFRFGFRGDVFPIGNHEGVIEGKRIFTDLAQVERVPDLAVLLVPASRIPATLDACGAKGTRHVIIESAGFTELGEDKRGLENEILGIASKWGITLQGPNCFGAMNMENGVILPFFGLDPGSVKAGGASFIGQSGGIYYDTSILCSVERVGLNKLASIGNKLSLNENDFLEYLISDAGTKVIGMYLEDFSEGRRLMELATRTHKPIVLVKGNRSRGSREIAHFHTTALAGDDQTADAAMAQAGVHRVRNLREMIDGLKIFSLPPLKGPNLAIVTRSGGHGVLSADGVERYGFKLARFPEALMDKIGENKAHVIKMTNPLDVGDIYDMSTYPGIVEMMLREEGIDGVVFVSAHSAESENVHIERLIREAAAMSPLYGKPVVLCMVSSRDRWFALKEAADIPVFSDVDDALYALSWSLAHSRYQVEKGLTGPWTCGGAQKNGSSGGSVIMDPGETFALLERHGLPVAAYIIAASGREATSAAERLGYPVAVKIASPNLLHKTEKGAVALDLRDAKAVRQAISRMEGQRYLVQKMAQPGYEVIVGGRQDREFGPVVVFGLGGIFVELLRDTSIRVAPIDGKTALDMIAQVKGAEILRGFRGKPPADTRALSDILVAVSRLLVGNASIRNIDMNPVIVGEEGTGCMVVDAKMEVTVASARQL
ncbi:MAG: acetate--CoA ligase family protein [Syntrophorhabdales bacterium]|jgi:acetyltransferase